MAVNNFGSMDLSNGERFILRPRGIGVAQVTVPPPKVDHTKSIQGISNPVNSLPTLDLQTSINILLSAQDEKKKPDLNSGGARPGVTINRAFDTIEQCFGIILKPSEMRFETTGAIKDLLVKTQMEVEGQNEQQATDTLVQKFGNYMTSLNQ